MNYKFPKVVTWSQIAAFHKCPQLFNWSELLGIQPAKKSPHLHAGAVFAAALETLRQTYFVRKKSPKDALQEAIRIVFSQWGEQDPATPTHKSLLSILGAVEAYTNRFPLNFETLIPQQIEFSFAVAIPSVLHPVSGEPLIFCGRLDALVKAANGCLYGFDDKTTSRLSSSTQWDISGQFTGYIWALRQLGIHCDGFIVRETCLKRPYTFNEFLVQRTEEQIDRWYTGFLVTLVTMAARFRMVQELADELNLTSGLFPLISGYDCTFCPYLPLCTASSPFDLLPSYQRGRWNPLTRTMETD